MEDLSTRAGAAVSSSGSLDYLARNCKIDADRAVAIVPVPSCAGARPYYIAVAASALGGFGTARQQQRELIVQRLQRT
jgi:hypothetical protein